MTKAYRLEELQAKAGDVAQLLKVLANESRLLILCQLVSDGETSVGALAEMCGLSQSALSQHLAKMRDEGLVATRRSGQTIYYNIQDPRALSLLKVLRETCCR